jgi:hypothetical protein
MSINFKAAILAAGAVSLLGAGQASAACDGSIQQTRTGRTIQCYYLPTVHNGRVDGLEKQVNYGGSFNSPYGGGHPAAVIGGNGYPPIRHR